MSWLFNLFKLSAKMHSHMRAQQQAEGTLRRDRTTGTWKHVVKRISYTANRMRIVSIYSLNVIGVLWPDMISMKVALKPPWEMNACTEFGCNRIVGVGKNQKYLDKHISNIY